MPFLPELHVARRDIVKLPHHNRVIDLDPSHLILYLHAADLVLDRAERFVLLVPRFAGTFLRTGCVARITEFAYRGPILLLAGMPQLSGTLFQPLLLRLWRCSLDTGIRCIIIHDHGLFTHRISVHRLPITRAAAQQQTKSSE